MYTAIYKSIIRQSIDGTINDRMVQHSIGAAIDAACFEWYSNQNKEINHNSSNEKYG